MRKKHDTPLNCRLCGRRTALTFHHLIPRKVHRRPYFRKHVEREALNRGIWVCRVCHRAIHKRFTEMELAKQYNSAEKLQGDAVLQRHFAWAARQKTAE